MANEAEAPSGVDLNLKEFTDIRFGLDRRLEEVARMLCSSTIPSVKGLDRPDLRFVARNLRENLMLTAFKASMIKRKNTKTRLCE